MVSSIKNGTQEVYIQQRSQAEAGADYVSLENSANPGWILGFLIPPLGFVRFWRFKRYIYRLAPTSCKWIYDDRFIYIIIAVFQLPHKRATRVITPISGVIILIT